MESKLKDSVDSVKAEVTKSLVDRLDAMTNKILDNSAISEFFKTNIDPVI